MRTFDPIPPGSSIRTLTDQERALLLSQIPSLQTSLEGCRTCHGRRTFRWLHEGQPTEFECNCRDQFVMHRYFLHIGIDYAYQRLGWEDARHVEASAQLAVLDYADNAEGYVNAGVGLLLHGTMGCIQGDAEIAVNRGGKGFRIKLHDLVRRQNGWDPRYRWNPEIPTYVQREVDGVVRLGRLRAAWSSGMKDTFTVTTETGRTIRATDEHPFLTERGWLRLDELVPGDEVHVRGPQASGRPRKRKVIYRQLGLRFHPYVTGGVVPLHRVVAEARLNGMDYEDFVRRIRFGQLHGLGFLDPARYAVHHVDHDPLNNNPDNLLIMTHADHHALHAAEGKTASVLFKIITEKVVSIEPYGREQTYDIEVEDDPHNFLANGFVVHNTGKTLLSTLLLRRMVADGHDVFLTTFQKLIDHYTDGWRDKALATWFASRIRNVSVLGIDDLGRENKARLEVVEAMLDELIRARVAAGRPTIITTNESVASLRKTYRANVMSLLTESVIMHEFTGGDYRGSAMIDRQQEVRQGLSRPIVIG